MSSGAGTRNIELCLERWPSWQYSDRKVFLRELLQRSCVPHRLLPKLLVVVLKGHSLRNLTTDNVQNLHKDKWHRDDNARVFPLFGNVDVLVDELLRSYAVVEGDSVRFAPLMRRVAKTLMSLLVVRQRGGDGEESETDDGADDWVVPESHRQRGRTSMTLPPLVGAPLQPETSTRGVRRTEKDPNVGEMVRFHRDIGFVDLLQAYHSLLHNPFHRVAELFVGGSFFLGTLCKQLHHFASRHIPRVIEILLRAHRTTVDKPSAIPLKFAGTSNDSSAHRGGVDGTSTAAEIEELEETDASESEHLVFLACHSWFLTLFEDSALPSDIPVIWTHFVCHGWKFMIAFALQLLEEATVESNASSAIAVNELPDEVIIDAVAALPGCVTDLDATLRRARKWYSLLATSTLLSIERAHIEACGARQAQRARHKARAAARDSELRRLRDELATSEPAAFDAPTSVEESSTQQTAHISQSALLASGEEAVNEIGSFGEAEIRSVASLGSSETEDPHVSLSSPSDGGGDPSHEIVMPPALQIG